MTLFSLVSDRGLNATKAKFVDDLSCLVFGEIRQNLGPASTEERGSEEKGGGD
jgi:hypothetical protein